MMHQINDCFSKKNLILSIQAIATFFLLSFGGSVAADSVYVSAKHNKIFIAYNGLIVRDLDTGLINNQCSPDGFWYDPAGNDVTNLLSTATDVVVRHNYAVVTTHPVDSEGNVFIDAITVDLTGCLERHVVPVEACIATIDLPGGFMTIPCVEFNGGYLTVQMHRRGNSDNWEVRTFSNNTNMSHHLFHFGDHAHDHDDDDDDDDDHDHHGRNHR